MAVITENDIELVGLAYLCSEGYTLLNGPDIGPDGSHPERQYTDVQAELSLLLSKNLFPEWRFPAWIHRVGQNYASFIGFTGTPIEAADKNTQAVFGKYVDIYDIQQAVDDGATVRIYYESHLAKVNFREEEKVPIDAQFEELTEQDELSERQKIKSRWTRLEAIVGNEHRLEKIAHDLVHHFEDRTAVLEGKGMVVAMSRRIGVDLYNILIRLRPLWHSDDDARGASNCYPG